MRRAPGIVKEFTNCSDVFPVSCGGLGSRRIAQRHISMMRKLTASTEKQSPSPATPTMSPASDGPNDAGSVEEGGIEADGGRKYPGGADEVGERTIDERNLQRAENAKEQSQHENPLDGNQAAKSQYAEDGRLN